MVRVKAKARKGDEAFQTRKQKVGRKKLAPATATRAEVHARTLRVTTPSAIARTALEEPEQKEGEGRKRHHKHNEEPTVAVSAEKIHREFKEQLSNTRHYKKSFRGAGFMSLVRAITANYEMQRTVAVQTASLAVRGTDLSDETLLSPIEILSAFTSALDAMSDTDGDVRRAALSTLKVILQPPSSAAPLQLRDYEAANSGEKEDENGAAMSGGGVTCDADRTRAVLSVVDVTLTHAMTSVRRSGVELLHLILQASPRGVRAVLRESDAWVKMVSRVSAILLQGTSSSTAGANTAKMIHVVPDLLETMLLQPRDRVDSVGVVSSSGKQTEEDVDTGAAPERILELFEECTPKWSMEWKELMEMRSAIFRDAERVQRATAIARAFACITMYMRTQSLLKASHTRLICHLFTVKMPFTMHELTQTAAASSENSHSKARVALANAIADACLPVADTASDACQLVRDFLSTVLRLTKGGTGSSSKSSSHPSGDRSGESRTATQLLGPLQTLWTAFVRFPASLLPRLLFLAPPMMQAVMRAVGGTDNNTNNTWGDFCLLAADVLAVLLTSQTAAASKQSLRFLAEAVLTVPRLLFSLRGKADTAMVDRVVSAFLRPLWRVASSGHPLLQTVFPAGDAVSQLRVSLPSLFGLRVPDEATPGTFLTLEGVLHRCTEPTRELAAHLLFYLHGEVPEEAAVTASLALASTLPHC